MKRFLAVFIILAALGVAACSSQQESQEPEQKQQKSQKNKKKITNREKAKAVGRFSDSIMTKDLEKNLVNTVDLAEKRAKQLKEALEEQ